LVALQEILHPNEILVEESRPVPWMR
jgi:hypothetical protein